MAPKARRQRSTAPSSDPNGMFAGMVVFLVNNGVQARRLQIWKQKLLQNGAVIEERLTKGVTHILAINSSVLQILDNGRLSVFQGKILLYQWLEDSLKSGEKISEDMYTLNVDQQVETVSTKTLLPKPVSRRISGDDEQLHHKRIKPTPEDGRTENLGNAEVGKGNPVYSSPSPGSSSDRSAYTLSLPNTAPRSPSTENEASSFPYNPPDLNKNITGIFGKLINIYRALGDDRRSFSYYKAITVIEKLPVKIESADQVQDLPSIGKSMKDHIQEIVTTGKLSKLEHFETDEKVRTVSLFGEVWGIGPATALKLYEKGYRTLEDLKNEDSLTNSQKLGLKYFDDIKHRIPCYEVEEMERILQKVGEEILLGVVVICGGSYRRGKATCGDMDIVITHPDGRSHRGFLPKFVKRLKEINFLREDLVFSIHSEKGTDSGVDTYFGFCTYPGRELRHRIDFKVYPRDIYALGLIAWTGNDVLNRRLRLLAESKGFRLDDTGLFPATQGSSGRKGTKASASLKFNTEKEVFDFLGFPWLEPHERNL